MKRTLINRDLFGAYVDGRVLVVSHTLGGTNCRAFIDGEDIVLSKVVLISGKCLQIPLFVLSPQSIITEIQHSSRYGDKSYEVDGWLTILIKPQDARPETVLPDSKRVPANV